MEYQQILTRTELISSEKLQTLSIDVGATDWVHILVCNAMRDIYVISKKNHQQGLGWGGVAINATTKCPGMTFGGPICNENDLLVPFLPK